MNEETRRRIAFAIARARGRTGSSVYSYTAGRHSNMSGTGGSYYDHESGSHFSDNYDHGLGAHWNYSLNGDGFSGYHHAHGHHFSGSIHNGSVQLYDHGDGSWHTYQV